MRNSTRLAYVGAAFAALSFASAANAATATADATAVILSTLTITADSALDFGTIAVNSAGTAVVSANGLGNSCTATALICGGTRAPAVFTITGAADIGVSVTLPTTNSTLTYVGWTGVGAAPTMTLSAFTSYFPSGSTLVLGETTVNVGGSLAVGATQAPGTYEGTFDVSAQYQ